jgi:hypothetical protein
MFGAEADGLSPLHRLESPIMTKKYTYDFCENQCGGYTLLAIPTNFNPSQYVSITSQVFSNEILVQLKVGVELFAYALKDRPRPQDLHDAKCFILGLLMMGTKTSYHSMGIPSEVLVEFRSHIIGGFISFEI